MILPHLRHTPSSTPADVEIVAAVTQRLLDVRSSAVRKNNGVRKSKRDPWVSHLHFGPGLTFGMTAPTFLELYESTGRGNNDWSIHRGGSLFIEGARDVSVRGCTITETGGNAVFISHAGEDIAVEDNAIGPGIGDSGVAVVGSLVRSNGLAGRNFPLRVSVARNTISEVGVYGKQVTGVYVSTAGFVGVLDNVISGSPSSGIKVDDTFIGGHEFMYNHVFDTTRETTDMGQSPRASPPTPCAERAQHAPAPMLQHRCCVLFCLVAEPPP